MSAAPRTRRTAKGPTPAAVAARTVVQILSVTGKRFTLDGLREKLRELYVGEGHSEIRAAAALSNVELLAAILDLNETLSAAGLQVRVINGLVSLGTTRIESARLSEYLAKETPNQATAGELTPGMLEVLACIAFKQPISQAEIDQIFGDTDKRAIVARLREMDLVTEFTGPGGRLQFATTETFLRHFRIASAGELAGLLESGSCE